MKRAFVRALWGDVANHRNGKIAKEIATVKDKDWFWVLAFGEENAQWLEKMGYKVRMIDSRPVIWDLETEMYRHKLEVFSMASSFFDEFAVLDWDCVPTGDISHAWDELGKKETFQANLFQYRTKKCLWREEDQRKVCNGGFAYFRDNSIPMKMIDIWNELYEWVENKKEERAKRGLDLRFREKSLIFDDEPAMSKYVDWVSDGWKGPEDYWNRFEPEVCNLRRKSAYSKDRLENKKACFVHNL
jgi:hypothetical protein